VSSTAITLFSLINGDDIHSTFLDMEKNHPIPSIGKIYLFGFILLFIVAILNVFIFTIEDAYHIAKVKSLKRRIEQDAYEKEQILKLYEDEVKKIDSELSIEKLFDIIEDDELFNLKDLSGLDSGVFNQKVDLDPSSSNSIPMVQKSLSMSFDGKKWTQLSDKEKMLLAIIEKNEKTFFDEIEAAKNKYKETIYLDVKKYILDHN